MKCFGCLGLYWGVVLCPFCGYAKKVVGILGWSSGTSQGHWEELRVGFVVGGKNYEFEAYWVWFWVTYGY